LLQNDDERRIASALARRQFNGQVVVTLTPPIAAKTAFRFFVFFEEGALPKTTREKAFRSKFL
jgi:hypothetical protein